MPTMNHKEYVKAKLAAGRAAIRKHAKDPAGSGYAVGAGAIVRAIDDLLSSKIDFLAAHPMIEAAVFAALGHFLRSLQNEAGAAVLGVAGAKLYDALRGAIAPAGAQGIPRPNAGKITAISGRAFAPASMPGKAFSATAGRGGTLPAPQAGAVRQLPQAAGIPINAGAAEANAGRVYKPSAGRVYRPMQAPAASGRGAGP